MVEVEQAVFDGLLLVPLQGFHEDHSFLCRLVVIFKFRIVLVSLNVFNVLRFKFLSFL